jgi:hypothetical protein
VLLLERPEVDPGRTAPTEAVGRPDRPHPAPVDTRPAEPLLLSPGLAVLVAASVLEAYRAFGIVPDGAWRPVAVAFAAIAMVGALALTRAGGPAGRIVGRTVVAAAGAAAVATTLVLWDLGGWTRATVGVADLLLAMTALAALVVAERTRRPDDGSP